jgi:hypothetical protein
VPESENVTMLTLSLREHHGIQPGVKSECCCRDKARVWPGNLLVATTERSNA